MKRRFQFQTSALFIASAIIALLLAACGSSTSTSNTNSSSTSNTVTATAQLQHMPMGTALLDWTPTTKTLAVQLTLSGLAPSSTHPAHIHAGSCANQGKVIYPLSNIVADAQGNATVTTNIANIANGIPASGWYINVHNGPGLSATDQFQPIACGDISNPNTATSQEQKVQFPLQGMLATNSNQASSGTAKLTLSGTTLTVVITLSGLAPNSTHAAHIHSGACNKEGGVVHPLNPITADASGNANSTTVIKNVSSIPSSGWYVNIHNSTTLTNQTGFDPIACGNVTIG